MNRNKHVQEIFPEYKEDQSALFDEMVVHDRTTYFNPVWDTVRQFEVDHIFELISARRILDVGCGCGYHDMLMAQKEGVESVVGIDYSSKSIDMANATYPHPKVRRYVQDIMKKEEGRFDVAVSFQVIEHLTDPVPFLSACARQVRPGGWVVALTPNKKRLYNRFRSLFGLPPGLEDPWHFREYTIDELKDMGGRSGLQYEDSFGYTLTMQIPKLNWPLIPWRLGLRLGYMMPSISNRLCVVFKKAAD